MTFHEKDARKVTNQTAKHEDEKRGKAAVYWVTTNACRSTMPLSFQQRLFLHRWDMLPSLIQNTKMLP